LSGCLYGLLAAFGILPALFIGRALARRDLVEGSPLRFTDAVVI
jgi:hypothetical protein